MKKLDDVLAKVDDVIDSKALQWGITFKKYLPLFAGALMVSMIVFIAWQGRDYKPLFIAHKINTHVCQVASCFEKLDQNCGLLGLVGERVPAEILASSSRVDRASLTSGSVFKLINPEKWQGPYLVDSEMEENVYEVVQAADGLFVVPSSGVELPQGFVMGYDICITKQTRVKPLLERGGVLNYQGVALGRQVMIQAHATPPSSLLPQETNIVNDFFKEFSASASYAFKEKTSSNPFNKR
jgi:hypothetical protein